MTIISTQQQTNTADKFYTRICCDFLKDRLLNSASNETRKEVKLLHLNHSDIVFVQLLVGVVKFELIVFEFGQEIGDQLNTILFFHF